MKRRMREKLLARKKRLKEQEEYNNALYQAAIKYLADNPEEFSLEGVGKNMVDTDLDVEIKEELKKERERIQAWVDEQHRLDKEDQE